MNANTLEFDCPASTGNSSQTGAGFTPKAAITMLTNQTAVGSGADFVLGFGISDGTNIRSIGGGSVDARATTTDTDTVSHTNRFHNTYLLTTQRVTSSTCSLDADGTTSNFTTVTSGVNIANFLLGGSTITNVAVGTFNTSGSTGNQSITGLGFQPDLLIFLNTRATADSNTSGGMMIGMGAATSSTAEWAMAVKSRASVNPSDSVRHQRTDRCALGLNLTGSGIFYAYEFTSMDSDGFSVNCITATTGVRIHYLALKGGSYRVGSFNQNTSNGNQSITGVGFQGTAAMFASTGIASNTSIQLNARMSVGVATSSSNRVCVFAGDQNNVATTISDSDYDNTKALKCMTEGTPTVDSAFDFVSFDSDGLTVNNTTTDATSREILYVIFGGGITARLLTLLGVGT